MDAVFNLRDAVATHSRAGHFVFESGHHGDLWLDLETLLGESDRMAIWARELAGRARGLFPEVVCGPQTGGAKLAQLVADCMNAMSVYTERDTTQPGPPLYRLPPDMSHRVAGRRVLVIDDAINAGSAVSASMNELDGCGWRVVAIGCLRGLGDTRTPMVVNVVGFWLVGLPIGCGLAFGLGQGPPGLWWGLCAGLSAVACALLWMVRRGFARDRARLTEL